MDELALSKEAAQNGLMSWVYICVSSIIAGEESAGVCVQMATLFPRIRLGSVIGRRKESDVKIVWVSSLDFSLFLS